MPAKKTAKQDTPSEQQAPAKPKAMHRMIVGKQPIHENGRFHAPGSEIELPDGRIKALGSLVEEAPEPKDEK